MLIATRDPKGSEQQCNEFSPYGRLQMGPPFFLVTGSKRENAERALHAHPGQLPNGPRRSTTVIRCFLASITRRSVTPLPGNATT